MTLWLRFLCWLSGTHGTELLVDRTKMQLRCHSCGYTSPGFDLSGPCPRVKGKKILQYKRRFHNAA